MTWQEKLQANLSKFTPERRTWTPEEMALAYEIDNEANGLNNRDTGCGSCRRAVISRVRNLAKKISQ
jgi:hypothetical protein